ncbi:MAG: PilZ domain-containing protein [Spirochaetes bacterium]|nr:PilZ domain-containing protein [Spirochaetota bacterium]
MNEKRVEVRLPKKIKTEVQTEDGLTYSTSADISKKGIFITTPEPSAVGQKLQLEMNTGNETITASAVVKWIRDEISETVKAGMGIEFVEIAAEDMEKIQNLN